MAITFAKAVKHEAKGRIALIGPAGSGKSFTMLTAAKVLAGNGKIAAIDTEHGSLSKYADRFEFDVIELDEFTAHNFLEALTVAEKCGYAVLCCDSLSHFWMGTGGALEFVDAAAKRGGRGDSFSGWKEWRPMEQQIIDRILASPCHIICTMRTKNEYVEEVNDKGKKVRRKIGLAPVQKDGLEYEFDIVGSMTEDNTFVVDKTRCSAYSGKAIDKPKEKDFKAFAEWLSGAPREAAKAEPEPNPEFKKEEPILKKENPSSSQVQKWIEEMLACKTIEQFNSGVVQKCKDEQRGREFVIMMATEAKNRGYKVDRATGFYAEGGAQ